MTLLFCLEWFIKTIDLTCAMGYTSLSEITYIEWHLSHYTVFT